MTCEDCSRSAAEPWRIYTPACHGCRARSISRMPLYREGLANPIYRAMLAVAGVSHDEVNAAAEIDAIRLHSGAK